MSHICIKSKVFYADMEQNAHCVPAGLTRSLACHGGRACLGEALDGSRRIIEKPEAPQGRRRKPWRKRKTQNSQVWDFVHEQRASVFRLRHPVMPQNKKRTERGVEIRQTCIGCFHARRAPFQLRWCSWAAMVGKRVRAARKKRPAHRHAACRQETLGFMATAPKGD